MILAGGVSGGISAEIAGGDFWKGFGQGVITSGLNHFAHQTAKFLIKSIKVTSPNMDPLGGSVR